MNAAPVHSLPGRVRFRAGPGVLSNIDSAGIVRSLDDIPGVKSVAINVRTGGILIRYDHYITSEAVIHAALQALEIRRRPASKPETKQKDGIIWSWVGWRLFRLLVPPALKPLVTLAGALPFFVEGIKSLSRARLDVPVLDAAALGASVAQGNINTASTLIMLLKTGEYLEAWAKERSRENLAAALALKTGKVWVRAGDGTEREISYEAIRQGDTIVLRAGALIPIDGRVIEGRALVNEAALTGEPLPVEKIPGGLLLAGTVIAEGELAAEVLKKG